jgi:hypothetical protein
MRSFNLVQWNASGQSSARGASQGRRAFQQLCMLLLGDVATPEYMYIERSPEKAHGNAANLPLHSFAFILRLTGELTYAIVANRPVERKPKEKGRSSNKEVERLPLFHKAAMGSDPC